MNKNVILHATMAIAALLVLALPPMLNSQHPVLKFQPLVNTMVGTRKEQQEKMLTISHALQGNAIFFLGASEVVWSADQHYAIYNYFNQVLHIPTVAYGGPMVESLIQYSLLARFKEDLSSKTKLVLLLSPDNFYRAKIPPRIFEDNVPDVIFDPLLKDPEIVPSLKTYLGSIRNDIIDHLSWSQLQLRGWSHDDVKKGIIWQVGSYCDLIRNYYSQVLHMKRSEAKPWPVKGKTSGSVDWPYESQQAMKMTEEQLHVTAATHWMAPEYFAKRPTPFEWSTRVPDAEQMAVFGRMMKMLHERHVNVVVIIDPMNPWAIRHTERFKAADDMISATLKKYQIPYFDMYKKPYLNGWNRDYLHPTDLTWVAMDQFVYEYFK